MVEGKAPTSWGWAAAQQCCSPTQQPSCGQRQHRDSDKALREALLRADPFQGKGLWEQLSKMGVHSQLPGSLHFHIHDPQQWHRVSC